MSPGRTVSQSRKPEKRMGKNQAPHVWLREGKVLGGGGGKCS